jgi:hypothetical protein
MASVPGSVAAMMSVGAAVSDAEASDGSVSMSDDETVAMTAGESWWHRLLHPEGAEEHVPHGELQRAAVTALVLLLVLNVADIVLTRVLLGRGGVEMNPVAEALLASNLAVVTKLGIVAALAVRFVRHGPKVITLCALWLVVGVYTFVVVLNGAQLVAAG